MSGRIVLIAAALAAAVLVNDAPAASRAVRTETGFQKVVAQMRSSGGTIILRRGTYGTLTVGPRSGRWLTVRARPGVTVRYLGISRARRVRIAGVRIRPAGGRPALLSIASSWRVTLDGLQVTAADTALSARVRLRSSSVVIIRHSRFERCGDGFACILLGRSNGVRILDSDFRDCYGCDFVRGRAGRLLVIRDSSFQRAVPGPCGLAWECNHQDSVQIQAGRDVLVEQNRFGLAYKGAGQLYLEKNIDGAVVRNNVFLGTDPAWPDLTGWSGIVLGNHQPDDLSVPRRVVVAHNTVLTGSTRPDGITNSMFVSPGYLNLPAEERPVVVSNVFGLIGTPERLCPLIGISVRNVTREGTPCTAADVVADPGLDETGHPLEGSIVVDQADPAWSPAVDLHGRLRDDLPDIGAFELLR